jgi:uncharacterized protein
MAIEGGIVELGPAECRDLLATDSVGRLAFVTPAGPRIVPVNYVVVGDSVEFRTTAYSELATYGPGTEVAFEIDHLDRERRRGWSVVASGPLHRLDDDEADELRFRSPAQDPQPWAGGHRALWLRLSWRDLSGRRVGGDQWPHPVVSGAP